MLRTFVRNRSIALAIGVAGAIPMLSGTALAQTATATGANPDQVLEQRSEQLEEQLVEEHQRMQSMEAQLRDLQNLIHGRTGKKATGGTAAVAPPGHQSSFVQAKPAAGAAPAAGGAAGTPQVQAS